MTTKQSAPVRITVNELRTRLAALARKWKNANSEAGRDDASRVSFLFGLYQQLSAPLDVGTAKVKKPRARKTVA